MSKKLFFTIGLLMVSIFTLATTFSFATDNNANNNGSNMMNTAVNGVRNAVGGAENAVIGTLGCHRAHLIVVGDTELGGCILVRDSSGGLQLLIAAVLFRGTIDVILCSTADLAPLYNRLAAGIISCYGNLRLGALGSQLLIAAVRAPAVLTDGNYLVVVALTHCL